MGESNQIDTFCRFTQVSRETITSLIKYENYLIETNKSLNLVGKSTINNIWIRHFLDSSQLIDFIDNNIKSATDIGTGAGFPGLIISILVIAPSTILGFATTAVTPGIKLFINPRL